MEQTVIKKLITKDDATIYLQLDLLKDDSLPFGVSTYDGSEYTYFTYEEFDGLISEMFQLRELYLRENGE